MRVADNMMFDQVTKSLSKNRSDMSDLQNQAATLKRVTKPSDDPVAATRVLSFRTEEQANNQFLKTANLARSMLEYSDQSLGDLSDVLVRAKELVMSQVNDASSSKTTRRLVAEEVKQLHQQAVQIGNRKLGERYLFGGYNTAEPPFDSKGSYKGDDGEILMPINKDAFVAANVPGSTVFLGKERLDHQVGDEEIVNPRDVQGLRKAQVHTGLVEKDQVDEFKPPATEEEQEELQAVRGPASVSPALSVGEQQQRQQGFGLNAANVEGRNIFRLLKNVEIGMRSDDKASLQDALDDLDEAHSQVVIARASIGSRVMSLDANIESIQKFNIDAKGAASLLEDVDQFDVVSSINKAESTLQATLQTSGKLIQPSLLDFLR